MLASTAPAVKHPAYSTPEQTSCAQAVDRSLTTFWALVERLRSAADQQRPIHQVEEAIFRDLLAMGLDLLQAFLALSGDGDAGPNLTVRGEAPDDPPRDLPRLDSPHCRPYLSIFGEIAIERICYGHGRVEAAPLDARLHLPRRQYSYLFQQWLGAFVVDDAHAEAIRKLADDPGVGDRGQGIGRPQPGAGQRRGAVPGPPADARRRGGGTDPGGDGRLQRGAVGAPGTAAGGGDRGPAAGVGEPASRQGGEGEQEEDGGGGRGLHDRAVRAHRRRGDRRSHAEEGRPTAARARAQASACRVAGGQSGVVPLAGRRGDSPQPGRGPSR